jgi:hypothetical protein
MMRAPEAGAMSARSLFHYLWASPTSVVGLALVPFVLLMKGHLQIVDGVLELHGPPVSWLLRRCVPIPGGALAMTLGHVVLGRDRRSLAVTRRHERVHVRQCEVWGPAFIPAYLIAASWGFVTRTGAYHGNVFERQAMRDERIGGGHPADHGSNSGACRAVDAGRNVGRARAGRRRQHRKHGGPPRADGRRLTRPGRS